MYKRYLSVLIICLSGVLPCMGADFYAGATSVDITPDRPVLLQGLMHTRVSQGVTSPITANILALESREGDKSLDSVIMVSIDVCSLSPDADKAIRAEIQKSMPNYPVEENILLAATHTHTSMCMFVNGYYVCNSKEAMTPEESVAFLASKIGPAVAVAWKNRQKSEFSYALGQAVIGHNRRTVNKGGRAEMYGSTAKSEFRAIEGYEDHDVNFMYFWNLQGKLTAVVVNVACPAQVRESSNKIDADYWHPVRERIKAKYGKDVCILGLCGAAGDLSPHPLLNKRAEERMTQLHGRNTLEEIAHRIMATMDDTYEVAYKDKKSEVTLINRYLPLQLPQQLVPKSLYEDFKRQSEQHQKVAQAAPDRGASGPHRMAEWTGRVVKRYEGQQGQEHPVYFSPINVVRIGDTVMCTNPFELYTDFGSQIKGRSKATQTFLVQLCNGQGIGGYLPSERAVAGGGYGAIPQSNYVGADGGVILTEKTVEIINSLFSR